MNTLSIIKKLLKNRLNFIMRKNQPNKVTQIVTKKSHDLILEYYQLLIKETLSESEAERIDQILLQAESDNFLALLLNEIDEIAYQKLGLVPYQMIDLEKVNSDTADQQLTLVNNLTTPEVEQYQFIIQEYKYLITLPELSDIEEQKLDKILQKATVDSSVASLLLEVDEIACQEMIKQENLKVELTQQNRDSYNKLKIGFIAVAGLIFTSIIALAAPIIQPVFFSPTLKFSTLSKSYESSNSLLNSMRESPEKTLLLSLNFSEDIITQEPDVPPTNLPQSLLDFDTNQIMIETENHQDDSNSLLPDSLFSLDFNFPSSQLSRNADIYQPDSLLPSDLLISLQSEELPLLSWDFNEIYQQNKTLAKEKEESAVISFLLEPYWTPIASSSVLGVQSSPSSVSFSMIVPSKTNEPASTVVIFSVALAGLITCKRHQ